jgi:hypothetical protein
MKVAFVRRPYILPISTYLKKGQRQKMWPLMLLIPVSIVQITHNLLPVLLRLNLFFTFQQQCQQRAADINAPLLLIQYFAGVVNRIPTGSAEVLVCWNRIQEGKTVKKFQVLKFWMFSFEEMKTSPVTWTSFFMEALE